VLVSDRRNPAQHCIGMIVWRLVDHGLEAMGVPGHDDVREQRQRPRDGAELLCRAAVLRRDHPVVDRPLQAVDSLALIEQVENLCSEHRVGEVLAEIKTAKQLAQGVAAVRAAVASLVAEDGRVTLAAIERASRSLSEGAVSAKTVLRNPECRALYAAAAGRPSAMRSVRPGPGALRAALAAAAGAEADVALAAPSAAEVRRVRRLDRRSKRELAAMVIRLEREAEVLHRHNANLREHLLRNGLGPGGRVETEPAEAGPLTYPSGE